MYQLQYSSRNLEGKIPLTPSKSISNRLLIIQNLCREKFAIQNISGSTDTQILERLLRFNATVFDVGDAGTACRFLLVLLSFKKGNWTLTGSDRMKQRPMAPLIAALRSMGITITCTGQEGFLPLKIEGGEPATNKVSVDGSFSSQFISALLMVAPQLPGGLEIELTRHPVSLPYISMTIEMMRKLGASVIREENSICVKPTAYVAADSIVENDWSGAAFWYCMCVLSKQCELLLPGLSPDSLQGDSVIATMARDLGIQSKPIHDGLLLTKIRGHQLPSIFEMNMQNYPDLVPPLSVMCAASGIEARFNGIGHLRYKESDRIEALAAELRKGGVDVQMNEDSFSTKGKIMMPAGTVINTHNDHRIAMAFSMLLMTHKTIVIDKPEVVEKSYPEWWDQLVKMGATVNQVTPQN